VGSLACSAYDTRPAAFCSAGTTCRTTESIVVAGPINVAVLVNAVEAWSTLTAC
jgi:hypothetical protein